MADQASVRDANYPGQRPATGQAQGSNGNGSAQTVVGSVAEFGNNIATLAELQAQLAAVDLKESYARATLPLMSFVVGVAVILGSIPILLLGAADLLARAMGITSGWAMILVAGVALVVSAVIAYLSLTEIGRSVEPLRRSREELVRNLAWIRTVLVHSGRSYPKRGS